MYSNVSLREDIPTDAIFTSLILEKPTFYEKESVLSDDEEDFNAVVEKKPVVVNTIIKNDVVAAVTVTPPPAADITVKEPVFTVDKVASAATSFKFTPITFESKTPNNNAVTKATTKKLTAKAPVIKAPAAKASATKATATKATAIKAVATKATVTKVSEGTPVVTKAIRPTRSTKVPTSKVTKVSSPVSTTASLAIQDKKPQPTTEQIEKLRLEAERKLERSKRFGTKLDEKDMKEIRAARFGISPVVEDKKKQVVKNVKKTEPAAADKKTTAQDILKKRAERFGIPEKRIVPVKNTVAVKKTPTKADVIKKTNNTRLNTRTTATVTKNQVKQGRVQKMAPKTILNNNNNKKAVTMAVTKNNVLNKKQSNVTTRLSGTTITQNKRNIINNRKVNIVNNKQQDRVITIASPKAAPVQRQMKTFARDIIINANSNIRRPATNTKRPATNNIGNGRTVTVGPSPSVSAPTNNKRRRGRAIEPAHQPRVSEYKRKAWVFKLTYILGQEKTKLINKIKYIVNHKKHKAPI